MKSIAIWHEPINEAIVSKENIELHFNLWKISNGANKASKFLDFGIKLKTPQNIKLLKIYFPNKVSSVDFEDIVDKFIDKPDLVSAIFNENYNVKSITGSKLYEITDTDNKFIFNIYKSSNSDLKFEEAFGGTVVTITLPQQNDALYLRCRIKGAFINSLSIISRPTNAIWESVFSEIEMIDFRVNEIRDLNISLLEGIKKKLFKIEKIHFFFICSNDDEVIGNHQPFENCRNLENYRWNYYVGLPINDNKIYLAYHWKQNNIDSSSVLIKTKYEYNNWKTITKYSMLAFLIAVAIELFCNWLYDVIKG